ncbi:MAG: LysR family transcriptional regulator [Hyphomicrobiales bacterium]|nr:LysR family transcriptional regulator [Hyphomicrobiales bacterium]MDE2016638.1 LysR family transcriptional regulator [Hyphomicrobiales bacterium]
MKSNLRHLRVFLAVARYGSVTRAAAASNVSQSAVTQAIAKLEALAGSSLFRRTPKGVFPTPAGDILVERARRAFALLDPALREAGPRLPLTATSAQLAALAAMFEAQNFTLAARRLGLAQPTVHRAIAQLEREAGRPLFERTPFGSVASRAAEALAHAALLAFAELDQAEADIADAAGREAGRIVVGAMPLSRARLLPEATMLFRAKRPTIPVRIVDGVYDDLLPGLRRGEIDMLVSALRDPPPIGDVTQVKLFEDDLALVCGPEHPLRGAKGITVARMADYPWVVNAHGTPMRRHFDALFAPLGERAPRALVETGSLILMRELLRRSDHLGCVSRMQAEAEVALGALAMLPFAMKATERPIGLTLRADWAPTRAQRDFLDALSAVAGGGTTAA